MKWFRFQRKLDETAQAKDFATVLSAELSAVRAARAARWGKTTIPPDGKPAEPSTNAWQQAYNTQPVGLAFSGGGIRSATFNLGVLQGLARLRLLPMFDYLSTVSGGGYIGGWLSAWIRRRDWKTVTDALDPQWSHQTPPAESDTIRFLRSYTNYLTPRKGFFSADTWTLGTTYMRNLALNLSVLVLATLALLMVPRLMIYIFHFVPRIADADLLKIVGALLGIAIAVVTVNLTRPSGRRHNRRFIQSNAGIVSLVVAPVFLCAWLVSAWLWSEVKRSADEVPLWSIYTAVCYTLIWIPAVIGAMFWQRDRSADHAAPTKTASLRHYVAETVQRYRDCGDKAMRPMTVLVSAFLAGLLSVPLLAVLHGWMQAWRKIPGAEAYAASFGMPLVILIFAVVAVAHVGLAGRGFSEYAREWWSRLGAYVLLSNLMIAALFAVAVYGPLMLETLVGWANALLASGWFLASLGGLLLGKSAITTGHERGGWQRLLSILTPCIFILGLFLVFSWLLNILLPELMPALFSLSHGLWQMWPGGDVPWPREVDLSLGNEAIRTLYWEKMNKTLSLELALGLFLCILLSTLLSWRVGINDFSLHALYRNRLVRAYLGASNPQRREDPFTGFDPHDDEYDLSDLVPSAQRPMPYLIVNTALNLVRGRRLAWQQRKAASFFLTPLYCGYDFVAHAFKNEAKDAQTPKTPIVVGDLAPYGFRRSEDYGDGVSLGTAMAISGAAASPNMGYHTSAPLAFLMTIFNVRLGWWLGNPRHEKTWQRSNPGCGLHYLLCELLGFTDDDSRYVYLSDGGHFENLGVYELVRRRCRVIVACDVGEDCGMKFSDLGNVIEKCQADFGIPIKIDLKRLRRLPDSRFSQWHCALGTIEYSSADPQATYSGLLLYIKSSLIDDEPANVCSYADANDGFPHQSTADQWFDESQFESYRALGEHVLAQVLEPAAEWGRQGDIEKFCQALKKRWPYAENQASDKGCSADSSLTPESG